MEISLTPVIKESFLQFGGAVLQSRALPDARDLMKPSARQIFYCLYTDKFIHEKPFQKTLKAIGSSFRTYIHGDSSAEGIIMRAGQPFAMRYPLIEVEGSYGTLLSSGSWAAPRYTSARLSELSNYLFADIQKDVIEEWRDNYDNTEQYPMILPSKGFYNLVNGGYGIGVGASSSCPQYNLKELNEALIKLLWNPEIDFEEIYCAPDFATGALLLNADEVKESHKNGTGAACKLRSVIEWDPKEKCLVVTEIPYQLYTETICSQLEEIINGENNPGIERFNDLTGKNPLIKIYISKGSSPEKVIKYLYKNTSLQSYYGVNFTFLENGRFPRVFGWKELLQSHLDHEKIVYTRGFEFDLRKIMARLHIIEGLMKAYDMIDEVVKTIKSSSSSKEANIALRELLLIDEIQAKAILDLKLSRLSKLDINKLKDEKSGLEKEKTRIEAILNDEILLKKEIEKGLREVAAKFGDARRTKIMNISNDDNDEEDVEEKQLSLSLTNEGAVFTTETSTLYSQRRNGTGSKFKLDKGEYVVDTVIGSSKDEILFFTSTGKFYHTKTSDFVVGEKQYLNNLISLEVDEKIMASTLLTKESQKDNIIFITKKGLLKKSSLSEYNLKRGNGAQAIKLDDDDIIRSVLILKDENIGILSKAGYFIMISTSDIRPIGRIARGVIGMKLSPKDEVISAHVILNDTKEIASISEDGYTKRTDIGEFKVTGRATKGAKIQSSENMIDFLTFNENSDILIVSNKAQIKIKKDDIPLLGRGAVGVKSIKLGSGKVVCFSKI